MKKKPKLFGSKFYLEEALKSTHNESPAFTVFVDNDSSLEINEITSGNCNKAQVCADGVFIGHNTCDAFFFDKD